MNTTRDTPIKAGIVIAVDLRRHRYAVKLPGFALTGCRSCIMHEDGTVEVVPWSAEKKSGGGVRLTGRSRSGAWALVFSPAVNARGVSGVRLEMSGKARRGPRVTELIPLAMTRLRAEHLLVHGRSAGGCKLLPLPAAQEQPFESYLQQMITRRKVTLQLCQPLLQNNPSVMRGRARGGAIRDLAVATPVAGSALRAEPLLLYADRDGHALMEAWAEEHGKSVKPPVEPVAGWNSWDYYRWTVTEEAVLRNAEFIAADPVLRRHVKRIIIDDGWQYCYGEWEANPLFPHGMKWLAKRLTALGFEPGLWFAPGVVEPHARVAQWDMDMLARGRSGLPCLAFQCMKRFGFVLDPTVPKTQAWLHDLFRRYADMGYTYFKLDFLKQTLNAPVFADASVPPGAIVRRLLEPARRALQGRAKIMGCGYDFFAGTACVDEVRTSSDIHARWDATKENVSSIAARWWAQGRLWGNDPDFALCRGRDTSDDPDIERLRAAFVFITPEMTKAPMEPYVLANLSLDEARTLLSLVIISGGAVNLSDDLTKLNARGLDLVRRTVAAERGAAGIPLDLFFTSHPSAWAQTMRSGRRLLLINWSDQPRELSQAGLASRIARNFWTDAVVPIRHGRLTHVLAPHACLLVDMPRERERL
jgi:hypothetical protein